MTYTAKARRLSLLRRTLGVRKKALELAVLCDASLCLLHFDSEGRPRTLPDDPARVSAILKRYLCSGKPKQKSDEVAVADGAREPADCLEGGGGGGGGPPSLGEELLDAMSPAQLRKLVRDLDAKGTAVAGRIALLKGSGNAAQQLVLAPPVLPPPPLPTGRRVRLYGDGTPISPEDLHMGGAFAGGIGIRRGSTTGNCRELYRDGTPCFREDLQ